MKVLIATDGSKFAKAAIKKCCEILAMDNEAEILIVSVAEIASAAGTEPFGVSGDFYLTINNQMKKAADEHVSEAKNLVRKSLGDAVKIDTVVASGSPKSAIIEEAEKWGSDLIIVGSHGYGFFERMLIGSVSDAILHHAPCSVLVVKVDQAENSD